MRFEELPTPCYVVDESVLAHNLSILGGVQQRTGAKIILALKGFAMHRVFPQIREVLGGTTASSVNEARLGREIFGGEVHAYAPAYSDADVRELVPLVDHLVFNSVSQFHRYSDQVSSAKGRNVSIGLRINPEYSEVATALYDPCRQGSRLGIRRDELEGVDLDRVDGFHFHTMCEQNSDTLERTVQKVEEKFAPLFSNLKWFNFGGGHHISRDDYDVDRLCRVIEGFQERHGLQVYLEPGEAIALNAGTLVGSVLDIVPGEPNNVILDLSATAHMPDVLEMPYRPEIQGAGNPGEKAHEYQLGGLTCLAGDQIGTYSFDRALALGDRLVFEDMAHYTMVKNTTFNGVHLPAIVLKKKSGELELVKQFDYEDYRDRLS